MNVRWSHCVLRVRDLEAMVAFYCETFGFRVADSGSIGPQTEIVFLSGSSSDHHQLALSTGRGPEKASSLDHNAFRVDSLADVIDIQRRMDADDRVAYSAPITHGNAISVYFADPEGNGIEVFWDTPWHVRQPQVARWDPLMAEDDILAAVRAEFENEPEFMPMEQYRAQQAAVFGEAVS
jgi:catechol-2,3-dioxygenase